jgi:hypothetical protein
MYQFQSVKRSATFGAGSPPPGAPGAIVNNILTQVPTEAVALVTALSPLVNSGKHNDPVVIWTISLGALALSVLVRWLNHASAAIWITTIPAFCLWMCLLPSSAVHLIWPSVLNAAVQIDIAVIAAVYSAIVATLASAGKIK